MTTPTSDQPDKPAAEGDAEPADLMDGWDWRSLILPVMRSHLGDSGKDPDEVADGVAEELTPLGELIDRSLAKRPVEATIEERVAALERQILLLRNVHDI